MGKSRRPNLAYIQQHPLARKLAVYRSKFPRFISKPNAPFVSAKVYSISYFTMKLHLSAFSTLLNTLPIFSATIGPGYAQRLVNDDLYQPRCHRVTRAPPQSLSGLSPSQCESFIPSVCTLASGSDPFTIYRPDR